MGLGEILLIAAVTLPLAGIPLAALLYLDWRRQCRADDETAKLTRAGHLRPTP